MIRFERTRSVERVRGFLSHPSQFPSLAHHLGSDIFARITQTHDCLIALEGGEALCLYMLRALDVETCALHISLLPHAWGARGRRAAAAFLEWFWQHTRFAVLRAEIAAHNRLAVRYAERAGFAVIEIRPKALRKNGVLCDLAVAEIRRPNPC